MQRLSLFILMLFCHWVQAQSDLVIVVASDSTIESLTPQHVSNIFLSKTQSFPDGSLATPIELKNNPDKEAFYASISGKSNSQLNAYWTTLVFTGKGKPPRGFRDNNALINQLLSLDGAITYLPLDEVTAEMKVIYRFP